jgi:hypothetical protein
MTLAQARAVGLPVEPAAAGCAPFLELDRIP